MSRLLLVWMIVLLPACAQPYKYWLTEDEDKKLREKCEATNCVTIPLPVWERIKQALEAALGVRL